MFALGGQFGFQRLPLLEQVRARQQRLGLCLELGTVLQRRVNLRQQQHPLASGLLLGGSQCGLLCLALCRLFGCLRQPPGLACLDRLRRSLLRPGQQALNVLVHPLGPRRGGCHQLSGIGRQPQRQRPEHRGAAPCLVCSAGQRLDLFDPTVQRLVIDRRPQFGQPGCAFVEPALHVQAAFVQQLGLLQDRAQPVVAFGLDPLLGRSQFACRFAQCLGLALRLVALGLRQRSGQLGQRAQLGAGVQRQIGLTGQLSLQRLAGQQQSRVKQQRLCRLLLLPTLDQEAIGLGRQRFPLGLCIFGFFQFGIEAEHFGLGPGTRLLRAGATLFDTANGGVGARH